MHGITPLLFACRQKDTQLVRLLLDQGANVNKWDGFHIWDTPLAACSSSNPEIVKCFFNMVLMPMCQMIMAHRSDVISLFS